MNKYILLVLLPLVILFSCKKEDEEPVVEPPSGKLVLTFKHYVEGQEIQYDTLKYTNEAGNEYMINGITYFVSDVTLHRHGGSKVVINDWQDIYYVDSRDASTCQWNVYDKIPAGTYDSVSFIFGIDEARNKNGLFINPPEINMFWPDFLGGGYHYLKLDGKWKDPANLEMPFNFHLGIGRDTTNTGQVVFVQNYFTVTLPASAFTLTEGKTVSMELIMNVESWFKTPHLWDWNVTGGAIMENQELMRKAMENGFDVFSTGAVTEQ